MVLVFCFPAILLTWIFKVVKKILAKVFEKKQTSDFAGLVVGWLGINSSVAPSDPTSFLLHKLLLRQRTLVAKVLLASSIFGGIYWAGRARSNPTGCGTKFPSRFFQRGWGRTSPVGERSLHWVKLWPSVVVGFGWAWLLRPVLALGRRRGLRLHRVFSGPACPFTFFFQLLHRWEVLFLVLLRLAKGYPPRIPILARWCLVVGGNRCHCRSKKATAAASKMLLRV